MKLGYGIPTPKTERKERVLKSTLQDAMLHYLDMLRANRMGMVSLGLTALDDALGGGVEPG